MATEYALKLGLKVYLTNVEAQMIDSSTLETIGIVLASFQVKDNSEELGFFKKLFY